VLHARDSFLVHRHTTLGVSLESGKVSLRSRTVLGAMCRDARRRNKKVPNSFWTSSVGVARDGRAQEGQGRSER
jgi:hypothetical protein